MLDYILNGQGFGQVASTLMECEDVNLLRPWKGRDGRTYVSQMVRNEHGEFQRKAVLASNLVENTSGIYAALRKDDWIALDEAVISAAKPRLRLIGDLRSQGLQYVLPNGFGKTMLQYETISDITPAEISMDPNHETRADRPVFDITNLPLPVIHKDFYFHTRQLAASRNGGTPLDTSTAELAARRVSEMAEQLALGSLGTYKYGGAYVYGLTNYPQRMTKVLSDPEHYEWSPEVLLNEVMEMKEQSQNAYHYGPWVLYVSSGWDKYLDGDYSAQKGDNTLRDRILKLDGITAIRNLDYLTGKQMLLVQASSDVIRIVIGMDMTTVQWQPTPFRVNFKVLCIMVPQLKHDINGRTGIVHGAVAE